MVFNLLPKERIISSFNTSHKKNLRGVMYITNIRVCWLQDAESATEEKLKTENTKPIQILEVNFPLVKIENKNIEYVDQEEEERSVLCIKFNNKMSTFSFTGKDYKKAVRLVKRDIEIAKNEFNKIELDSEEKFKITKLMETKYLRDLFKELVESGKVTEEEFWDKMTDIKQFSKKEQQSKMKSGVPNQRIIISNEYILYSNSTEINFQKAEALRLLNEYPKLKELYDMKVTDDEESEK